VGTKPGSELLAQFCNRRVVESRVHAQRDGRVGVAKQPSNLDRSHRERERERRARVADVVATDRLSAVTVQAAVGGRVLNGAQDVAAVKWLAVHGLKDKCVRPNPIFSNIT
jgi:hypothetical protein